VHENPDVDGALERFELLEGFDRVLHHAAEVQPRIEASLGSPEDAESSEVEPTDPEAAPEV
jgi:hypothetical protein